MELVCSAMFVVGICTLSSVSVVFSLWCRNDYKLMIMLTVACSLVEMAVVTDGNNATGISPWLLGAIAAVALYFIFKLGRLGYKYVSAYRVQAYDLSLILGFVVQVTLALLVLASAINMMQYVNHTIERESSLSWILALGAATSMVIFAPAAYLRAVVCRNKYILGQQVFYTDTTLAYLTESMFALEEIEEISPGTKFKGVAVYRGKRFPFQLSVTLANKGVGIFKYDAYGMEAYLTEPYRAGFQTVLNTFYVQYMASKPKDKVAE